MLLAFGELELRIYIYTSSQGLVSTNSCFGHAAYIYSTAHISTQRRIYRIGSVDVRLCCVWAGDYVGWDRSRARNGFSRVVQATPRPIQQRRPHYPPHQPTHSQSLLCMPHSMTFVLGMPRSNPNSSSDIISDPTRASCHSLACRLTTT